MNNIIPADSRNKETHPPSTAVSPSTLLVIGEEFLNSRDVLRVALDQFKGRRTVDIRKHYKREDGTVAPTRKGLTLSIDRLPALAELITAALDRARADGLLPAVSR